MNRWKSALLHHWRAKLLSLAVAVLVWLALRHTLAQNLADTASATPATGAADTRLGLAFRRSGVEKRANIF